MPTPACFVFTSDEYVCTYRSAMIAAACSCLSCLHVTHVMASHQVPCLPCRMLSRRDVSQSRLPTRQSSKRPTGRRCTYLASIMLPLLPSLARVLAHHCIGEAKQLSCCTVWPDCIKTRHAYPEEEMHLLLAATQGYWVGLAVCAPASTVKGSYKEVAVTILQCRCLVRGSAELLMLRPWISVSC